MGTTLPTLRTRFHDVPPAHCRRRGSPRSCRRSSCHPQLHHLHCPLRGSKNPSTPNEQAAALAGTAEKKVGHYKVFNEVKGEEDLFGPGAAPGTVPTDLEQATGLERLEILGKMEGVDI